MKHNLTLHLEQTVFVLFISHCMHLPLLSHFFGQCANLSFLTSAHGKLETFCLLRGTGDSESLPRFLSVFTKIKDDAT